MKILITYYSFSGNTYRVAKIFADRLSEKGEIISQRLKPTSEITTFSAQCYAALIGRRAKLKDNPIYDVSPFDLVILGSPVWAFAPVPAMNSYLDRLNGLHGKRVIVVLTSGSGLGVKRCFKHIRAILHGKGASSIDEINIPDRRQGDAAFIAASIAKY
jgi:flavodoxin